MAEQKIFIADKPTLDKIDENVEEILRKPSGGGGENVIAHVNRLVNTSSDSFGTGFRELFSINGKGKLLHLAYAAKSSIIRLRITVDGVLTWYSYANSDNITGVINHNLTSLSDDGMNISVFAHGEVPIPSSDLITDYPNPDPPSSNRTNLVNFLLNGISFNDSLYVEWYRNSSTGDGLAHIVAEVYE